MSWNYRLIHHDKGPEWIGIHEVFYDGDKIRYWSENASDIKWYIDDELNVKDELDKMKAALDKPVLLESELINNG